MPIDLDSAFDSQEVVDARHPAFENHGGIRAGAAQLGACPSPAGIRRTTGHGAEAPARRDHPAGLAVNDDPTDEVPADESEKKGLPEARAKISEEPAVEQEVMILPDGRIEIPLDHP